MFEWGFNAAFFLGAAIVQFALAAALIVTRPRSEWGWVVALLFAFNGGLSFLATLREGYASLIWDDYSSRLGNYLDPPTSWLIAYLALIFPTRPRSFRDRPWLLRAIVLGPCAALLVAYGVRHELLFSDPPNRAFHFVYVPLAQSAAWFLVLVRWSLLLPHEPSPVLRRQFQFVFAAFGIRAAHMGILAPINYFENVPVREAWDVAVAGLHVATLLAVPLAFALLIARRPTRTSEARSSVEFVLAFLVLGVFEALWSRLSYVSDWNVALFAQFDLFAVRPALLWVAMVRFGFLDRPLARPETGLWFLGALSLGAFLFALRPRLLDWFEDRFVGGTIAFLASALLAGALVLALRPALRASALSSSRGTPIGVDAYLAAVEERLRQGTPKSDDDSGLRHLAARLGIPTHRHRALVSALRSRAEATPRREWLPGDTILGRYQVEGLLGAGGCGETFRATDLMSGEEVVLKRTTRLDPGARHALLREAFALSRLNHPNVLPLLRTESVAGEPVLVLAFMPGGSLASKLAERNRLEPQNAVRTTREILSALGAAHERGIVHRDVKPSNVLFDALGQARLADFGVARLPDAPAELVAMTRTGDAQPGTLRYMAPEQVRGLPADPRSDLYAVGVLLHEMVTGHHYLEEVSSDFELRRRIVAGPGVGFARSVPASLRKVLSRAVARAPSARFRSAAEFEAALARSIAPEDEKRTPRPDHVARP